MVTSAILGYEFIYILCFAGVRSAAATIHKRLARLCCTRARIIKARPSLFALLIKILDPNDGSTVPIGHRNGVGCALRMLSALNLATISQSRYHPSPPSKTGLWETNFREYIDYQRKVTCPPKKLKIRILLSRRFQARDP